MIDCAEMGALAQARSEGYWLLARLFLQVPDGEHLQALHTGLASVDDAGMLGQLRRTVAATRDDPDSAAVEFTRRLVAIGKESEEPLPYESFVREGIVPGAATQQVLACMAQADVVGIACDGTGPDHLGNELRFMAVLCRKESVAWSRGNAAALEWCRHQQRFLDEHIGAWAIDYCKALEARCEHDYMRTVARIAYTSLESDATFLRNICIGDGGWREAPTAAQA